MLALHESTATVNGPAAPTKGFKRSKSAWRDDEETVDEETLEGMGMGGQLGVGENRAGKCVCLISI